MKARILVTGGTGYIGSHTAVELIEDGFEVLIVDNLSHSRREVLDGIEKITGVRPDFEQADLCDAVKIRACCSKYGEIKAILHFAALKAVGESVDMPLEYYQNNLTSTINVLRLMKEYDIPVLIFSSSCTVYGKPDIVPVTEDSPLKPASSPYGNTKRISEEMIRDYVNITPGHRAISLRYFNPIGAHPSAWIGEYPTGTPLNLVPYLTQTAIGKRKELKVFGNDYPTPDGTGIRDYIYVVDLARAHVAALNRLFEFRNRNAFEVYNLGTGRGVSVLEVIRTFETTTGRKVRYRICPRRAGDIDCVYADASLANRELGWKTLSTLEETLITAWNWEKQILRMERGRSTGHHPTGH